MSENKNSSKRQSEIAKHNCNENNYTTFNKPTIEKRKFGYIIPSITRWDPSLLNSPQSYSSDPPQVRDSSYHHFPMQNLPLADGDERPKLMGYMHINPNTKPRSEVMVSNLTHKMDTANSTRPMHGVPIEVTKSNIPKFYPEDSECSYSQKPVVHPIINRLDTLPQQISKFPVRVDSYSSLTGIPVMQLEQFSGPSRFAQPSQYGLNTQEFRSISPCFETNRSSICNRILNELDLSQDVQDSFAKLGPLLSNINSRNYSLVLVEILRKFNDQISLDELYNLLYSEKTPLESFETSLKVSNNAPSNSTYLNAKALTIFRLILITFQSPKVTMGYFPDISVHKLRVSPATFHKLLRNFLAIKIILASVKKSNYPSRYDLSISRVSIYKVYYIICRKLIQKFPMISSYPGFEQNLILSQPRISKITNLIYPNIITKRLGKRGESKAHYVGLTLNSITVDQEISRLLELDISELKEYFRNKGANSEAGLQIKIDRNNLNSAADHYSTHSAPGFQEHLDTHVQSWYKHQDQTHAARIWTQRPSIIRDQQMGPALIWKDIWKP
ncbi:hypothetical protein JCM33374_g5305 [Metschnikowia sp. JCM 33374]|nr:hypothetical protein JCM33374_g5305 [Metschnikowia sp. JCM 33374]